MLAAPPAPTADPAGAFPSRECRVWERHACDLDTTCQPVAARGPGEMSWKARIRDVSVGGVGVVVVRRFERGTGLAVEVPGEGDLPGDTLLARVVHVRAMPGGEWLLGCSFISPLSEDEVARLSRWGKALAERPAEPRAPEPARAVSAGPEVLAIPAVHWQDVHTGATRVARRLFLKGVWPLPAGAVLDLAVAADSPAADKTRVVVRSCTGREGEWLVRYAVLGRPSAPVRRWLGGHQRDCKLATLAGAVRSSCFGLRR